MEKDSEVRITFVLIIMMLKTNEYKCELTFSFFRNFLLGGGCSGRRKHTGSTRSLPTGRRTTRLALHPIVIGLAHDIFAIGAPLKETTGSQLILN